MMKFFKEGTELRNSMEFLGEKMNGTVDIRVRVEGDMKEPETLNNMINLQDKLEKFPNGVYKSQDIMDHIYDTETEAQTAANFLGCMGTHTHIIKGKKIWMPCHMN